MDELRNDQFASHVEYVVAIGDDLVRFILPIHVELQTGDAVKGQIGRRDKPLAATVGGGHPFGNVVDVENEIRDAAVEIGPEQDAT